MKKKNPGELQENESVFKPPTSTYSSHGQHGNWTTKVKRQGRRLLWQEEEDGRKNEKAMSNPICFLEFPFSVQS